MNVQTKTVAKNSLWLIAQPLLLSMASLFVIGFLARKLGPNDYGVFVFSFAFISMFSPFINMGLRALMVRTIAEDKTKARECLGGMLIIRFILGVFTIVMVYLGLQVFEYSKITIQATMLASITLLLQSLTSAFHDSFQAFEKMRFVALTQLIPGVMLLLFTVLALYFDAGLIQIIIIYVLSSLLTLTLSGYFQWKYFEPPIISFDVNTFAKDLKRGLPFFLPQLIYKVNGRLGVIFLSKLAGNSDIAMYGAATNLTDKLLVVPDGIGTSIFPAISSLMKKDRDGAIALFKKFSRYIFLLGFPMAVGTWGLSDNIINLIYGVDYKDTAIVLSVLIWGTFFQFILSIYDWTLNAMHYEKLIAKVSFILMPFFVVPCYWLIKEYGFLGAAIAHSSFQGLKLLVMSALVRRYITKNLYPRFFFIRSFLCVFLMWVVIDYLKEVNFFVGVFVATMTYVLSVVAFRLIDSNEVEIIKTLIFNKIKRQ